MYSLCMYDNDSLGDGIQVYCRSRLIRRAWNVVSDPISGTEFVSPPFRTMAWEVWDACEDWQIREQAIYMHIVSLSNVER